MRGLQPNTQTIEDWLQKVSQGKVLLPEFQRDVVWNHNQVCIFLEAIFRNQPIGCLLLLPSHNDEKERFLTRPIEGTSPEKDIYGELLLDGQQRLTALWRALTNSDKTHKYFIEFDIDPNENGKRVNVHSYRKSLQWINNPDQCFERLLIPISLLWVNEKSQRNRRILIQNWLKEAENRDPQTITPEIVNWIEDRSEELRTFMLPFLIMDDETTKLEAIETYIQTNTSSHKLRKFDIVVGELMRQHDAPLRDIRDKTIEEIPEIEEFFDYSQTGDLLLKIACLCSSFVPTESNYLKPSVMTYLAANSTEIISGIRWTISLLKEDRIFDGKRLPSVIPFRVLPALFLLLSPDERDSSTAKKTARAYMWRSFITERYDRSAHTNLKQDFDKLKAVFGGTAKLGDVPLWDISRYPLPDTRTLMNESWPTRVGSMKRAILAVSLRAGARDLLSDKKVTSEDIAKREYHHIFPKKYLEKSPHLSKKIDLALNCVLINQKTNRKFSAKPPIEYFVKVCQQHGHGTKITDNDIKSRLKSHVVPTSLLTNQSGESIEQIYTKFLKERSNQILKHLKSLADGSDPR